MIGHTTAMRQIHLDFHTSEKITEVAKQFNAEDFSETFKKAHVNSVNLFARCHHGMMYYNSKLFPERIHPHLKEPDLLKLQTEACRAKGIKVNLYTSVRWDVYTVKNHQEWVCIDEKGALSDYEGKGYFEAGFYKNLCVNTPYRDFLKEHLLEVMEDIPADGIWFDASFVVECCCPTCIAKMKKRGMNPGQKADRQKFAVETYQEFVKDMSEFIHTRYKDYDIFYNKGHVGEVDRPVKDSFTYFAMESLPGGPWDYLDFPHSQRYIRNWGKPTLGLTGKFHTSWGDFHSFREQTALEYECFHMLALGAECNIGDQMEPSGVLSAPVYDMIGKVYEQVEKKEPWCIDAEPVSEIGMLVPEEFFGAGTGNLPRASQGGCRLLQEQGYQFEFIDTNMDYSKFRLLILPDVIPVDEKLAERLKNYMDNGGKVLLSYQSGLDPKKQEFALQSWGISYKGEAFWEPDFIVPEGTIGEGLPLTEHVMYQRGSEVGITNKGHALCMVNRPYFNRTWEHFSSHMHAPSCGETVYPGIVAGENSIYFSHPVFTTYFQYRPKWYRRLLLNAIHMLMPDPLVVHDGPTTVEADLTIQKEQKRLVLHMLHYIPEHRSELIDTVEDVIPLYQISVSIRSNKKIKQICLVPERKILDFSQEGEHVKFKIPEIRGHQMVELSWA